MSGFITASLLFSSGICRYRFVLVYALYSFLKALSSVISVEKGIYLLFAPAYLISFYFDATSGPIYPLYSKNNLIIALLATVIADDMIRKSFYKFISYTTAGQCFVVCPSCNYRNKEVVEKCQNCSYKKGNPLSISITKISPVLKGDKIPTGLLNLINIGENAEVLFHKRLTSFTQKLKNGLRQARKHFVITTENLIILDYYSFHIRMPNSWRERDIIPLSEIVAVEGLIKKFYMTMRPCLIIRTIHGDVFEIVFSTFENYDEQITDIANIIKKANPLVNVILNMKSDKRALFSQFTLVEGIDSKKIRRLMKLLLLLLILLALALWRLFRHI